MLASLRNPVIFTATLLLGYQACTPVERPFGDIIDDELPQGGEGNVGDGDGDLGDGDGDLGDGDGDLGDGDGDLGDGDGDTGTGGMNTSSNCVDVRLGEELMASANTSARTDDYSLGCATGSAPDVVFEWTAPYSDYFMVSSEGSSFDTVVGVLSGDCDNSDEIACNDNFRSDPQGQAVFSAEQGETYLIVVDGNSGGKGAVELSIEPVTCPSSDVSEQALPATFTTVGGPNDHVPQCDTGADSAEKTIRYAAPTAGLYNFRVDTGSSFSPSISVNQGAICGGQYLQCNANVGGNPADVSRYLEAGEAVTITVEGGEGEFELDINRLPDTAQGCSALPALGSGASGTISTSDGRDELTSSCEWSGNAVWHYPEHAYTFTVDLPDALTYCSVEVNLTGAGFVYLLEGTNCSGPEVSCGEDSFLFGENDNGDYTIVVENFDPFQSPLPFTITSDCD